VLDAMFSGTLCYLSVCLVESPILTCIKSDLAARSPGPTMDKFTFLKFFNVPGMLGERLFAVFDKFCSVCIRILCVFLIYIAPPRGVWFVCRKKDGVLDFEEFLRGMADFSRGTIDQKIRLLFNMYDLTGDGFVSRVELSTVLHSLVCCLSYMCSGFRLSLVFIVDVC